MTSTLAHDQNGLEILDHEQCLEKLRTAGIGRLAFTSQALPVVVPVNFVIGEIGATPEIVIGTRSDSKLQAAARNAVVALEVDGFDVVDHSGWSVLVQGRSRLIDDPVEVAVAHQLPLLPWAADRTDMYIAVALDIVSGRRLSRWE